jgi:hypothetical protein
MSDSDFPTITVRDQSGAVLPCPFTPEQARWIQAVIVGELCNMIVVPDFNIRSGQASARLSRNPDAAHVLASFAPLEITLEAPPTE